jgi:hypothetical protein
MTEYGRGTGFSMTAMFSAAVVKAFIASGQFAVYVPAVTVLCILIFME